MPYQSTDSKKAYEFLVRAGIIRPNERTLEGQEKLDVYLILSLLEPNSQSNNQRFWTDHYIYANKEYSVTYFDKDDYEIIEVIREV